METEYRLGVVRLRDAGLGAAAARKRARLEAWLDEQLRAQGAGGKGKQARTREDSRREVEQQAFEGGHDRIHLGRFGGSTFLVAPDRPRT